MARVAMAGAALLTLASAPAAADVVDKSAGGFTLKTTVAVAAPPDRVFRALVDVGAWWSGDHTYSGDARNMSIAPCRVAASARSCPRAAASSTRGSYR